MKTSIWFSWAIFAVAIAAFCLALLRCEPIKADWISIDIGVLAALATCLVGWQIYTLIDLRQYKSDFNALRSEVATSKLEQQRALREVVAEYTLKDAAKLIGSFSEDKQNYDVIGIGYCLAIRAARNLTYSNQRMIREALELMRQCIFLARLHNAWDKIFNDEVARIAKEDYHLITIGLAGGSVDYMSQIDEIKTWRLTKTMDDKVFKEILAKHISQ